MPRAQWSGNEAILYLDYITWNKANKDLKKNIYKSSLWDYIKNNCTHFI